MIDFINTFKEWYKIHEKHKRKKYTIEQSNSMLIMQSCSVCDSQKIVDEVVYNRDIMKSQDL